MATPTVHPSQARIVSKRRVALPQARANRRFRGQLTGEQLILLRRSSRLVLLGRCLPLSMGLLGVIRWHGAEGWLATIAYLASLLIVAVSAVWALRGLWRWWGQVFLLTTERVMIQSGMLRRQIEQIEIVNVSQVIVERPGVVQMLFGLGTVVVRPTGTPLRLPGVRRPRDLADLILALREQPQPKKKAKGVVASSLHNKQLQQRLAALQAAEAAPLAAPTAINRAPLGGFLQRRLPIRLIAGESVVEIVYRHWIVLLRRELPVALLTGVVVLVNLGLWWLGFGSLLLGVLGAGIVAALLVAVALVYMDWADDVFVLTTHRVIDIDRIFFVLAEYSNDAPYSKIQDVRVEQGFLGHLLGYGSILVETAGRDQHLAMRDIPDARGLMNRLFAQVEQARQRETQGARQQQRVETFQWMVETLDGLLAEMPAVIGLPLLMAATQIDRAGLQLVVDGERFAADVAAGVVLAQSPQAGSTVLAGGEAHVVVCGGQRVILEEG